MNRLRTRRSLRRRPGTRARASTAWLLVGLVLMGGTLPAGALLVHTHDDQGAHAHGLPLTTSLIGLERSQAHHDWQSDHGHRRRSASHGHAHTHGAGHGHSHSHPHPDPADHGPEWIHGHVLHGIALDVPAPPPASTRTALGALQAAREHSATRSPMPGLDLHADPRLPDVHPRRRPRDPGRESGAARVMRTSHAFLI